MIGIDGHLSGQICLDKDYFLDLTCSPHNLFICVNFSPHADAASRSGTISGPSIPCVLSASKLKLKHQSIVGQDHAHLSPMPRVFPPRQFLRPKAERPHSFFTISHTRLKGFFKAATARGVRLCLACGSLGCGGITASRRVDGEDEGDRTSPLPESAIPCSNQVLTST